MGDRAITGVIAILTAVVGIAALAVIVSKQADTANVLGAAGKAFGGILGAAVGPVSGGSLGGVSLGSFSPGGGFGSTI